MTLSPSVAPRAAGEPEAGTGVPCQVAQCDGVPCPEVQVDCEHCDRATAAEPPRPSRPPKPTNA